jgi:CubicO group peptidase (beta-lactamase class C family)
VNRINSDALNALVEAARVSRSTALVVWQDDGLPLEWWFDGKPRPIETMSVTKSVVNMIVGRAVTLGLIESAETPVHDFFPEWKQGRKRDVTLRHLMDHTSGLQDHRTTNLEIYPSPDFVKLALAAELEAEPGTRFKYSNKAVNLLTGIVARATGKAFQRFAGTELFDPLEIEFDWMRDEAGNAHGMAGFQVQPRDLLKLGRLMLQGGRWSDSQLISSDWVKQSLNVSNMLMKYHGWLWWLQPHFGSISVTGQHLEGLERVGATPDELAKYNILVGEYRKYGDFSSAWDEHLDESFSRFIGQTLLYDVDIQGLKQYSAQGYLGQYLVVIPEHRLVAVRMLQWFDGAENQMYLFADFQERVVALVNQ